MDKEKLRKYKREWQKRWRVSHPIQQKLQQNKDVKLYRERHPEKVKKMVKISVRKWRNNNPEKTKAHRKVFIAMRNGSLVKQPCFECKETETQAHHKDYSKPLDVKWLCKAHHILADKERREDVINNLSTPTPLQ